jgi:hypothetical protein
MMMPAADEKPLIKFKRAFFKENVEVAKMMAVVNYLKLFLVIFVVYTH